MMNLQLDYAGKRGVLTFTGDLIVRHAAEMRTVVIEALAGAEAVSMDFVDVTAVDLSFLQLLCSAHRTAVRLNKGLEFAGSLPGALVRAMEAAGYVRRSGCKLDSGNSCLWVGRGGKGQQAS